MFQLVVICLSPLYVCRNAIQCLGYRIRDVLVPSDIDGASVLVFPGVGRFDMAMNRLKEKKVKPTHKMRMTQTSYCFSLVSFDMSVRMRQYEFLSFSIACECFVCSICCDMNLMYELYGCFLFVSWYPHCVIIC